MKFEKILEYQKVDQELIALENEVAKSKERTAVVVAKSKIDSATEMINKLGQEASEMLGAYNKLKSKTDELKARLDEFDGVIEGVADLGEADYYVRQIAAISDEIAELERETQRDASRIDGIGSEYKKTWEQGIKASDSFKTAKTQYDRFIAEKQPKVAELNKVLTNLKKDIPAEFLEIYQSLRNDKRMPAFVEYDPTRNVCGRCFMDVPNDTRSKLKNPGDYAECPNCRRILFITEK